ncbi:beta-hexosaminidase [Chitinophaga silvatica]|uniref:beta-N-acetylhexosaminidase n=1 Tax=Chitinophaga silvatica TaxID=2282649 RepID=A0A3E1YED7_9BACT|nr:family 20 glycosylhydrolase [Chitinophaga silvatica]RFS24839.1 beta-hexosaminidase [Chitinophaga silvatica]
MKSVNYLCLVIAIALCSCSSLKQADIPKGQISIIPLPASVKPTADSFLLDKQTVIVIDNAQDEPTAALLNAWIKELTGYELSINHSGTDNAIFLHSGNDTTQPEGYSLKVENHKINITGNSAAGTFYGVQTLMQLLPLSKSAALYIPGVGITDSPRFAYRGLHLDAGRHFFPVSFVKKYIDLMAFHKFNTFHWHLTEDQGWRIEIKKYPRLQEIASKRKETMKGKYSDNQYDGKPYGGYYTQEEIKEVVKYAQERFVTIIPEIEMPGHSLAALAAYPDLGCTGGPYETGTRWGVYDDVYCAGNDSVFVFLQNVLDEVIPLFPGKYIHIGGDECPKVRWEKCPKCQARMKLEGLKNEHALQSYFIQRMEKYLNSKGKQIIGWDEILEGGLAPNATVMSWRGIQGGIAAAKQHHDVVMTPGDFCYFDHYQSLGPNEPLAIGGFLPVKKVYEYEPIPAALSADEAKYIKGAQANLWSEYISNNDYMEYMVYPRATALAEVLWSPADKRNYNDFLERLKIHVAHLDKKKVNYAKHIFEVTGQQTFKDGKEFQVLDSKLQNGKIFFTTDSTAPTPQSTPYTEPIAINQTGTIRAQVFLDKKPFGNEYNQHFIYHKALGRKVKLTNEADASYRPVATTILVDGIRGNESYNDNQWFGYKDKDFQAIVDLDSVQDISNISIRVLQKKGDWIYAPGKVTFSVSEDGEHYKEVFRQTTFNGSGIITVNGVFNTFKGRYVKADVQRFGKIPAGAEGAGDQAWLMVNELEVH